MVKADFYMQFNVNMLYWLKNVREICWKASLFQCWIVVGILAGKTELHKELLNCPQALWVPPPSTLPF